MEPEKADAGNDAAAQASKENEEQTISKPSPEKKTDLLGKFAFTSKFNLLLAELKKAREADPSGKQW